MDIYRILEELREQHAQVGEAIICIERLAIGSSKRRGRPPAWISTRKKGTAQNKTGRKEARNTSK
jgi:hypothetical protein